MTVERFEELKAVKGPAWSAYMRRNAIRVGGELRLSDEQHAMMVKELGLPTEPTIQKQIYPWWKPGEVFAVMVKLATGDKYADCHPCMRRRARWNRLGWLGLLKELHHG